MKRGAMRRVLPGILFALGGSGAGCAGGLGDLREGSEAPDFAAADLRGRPLALSQLRGRVVVLDFWATWCGPCLLAMPGLQEVHEEFGGRGVEVLAVNLGEDPEDVGRFLEENGYTFAVVADEERAIGRLFGVRGIPAQVVLNQKGLVAAVEVGYDPEMKDRLRQLLERLTREDPPPETP